MVFVLHAIIGVSILQLFFFFFAAQEFRFTADFWDRGRYAIGERWGCIVLRNFCVVDEMHCCYRSHRAQFVLNDGSHFKAALWRKVGWRGRPCVVLIMCYALHERFVRSLRCITDPNIPYARYCSCWKTITALVEY